MLLYCEIVNMIFVDIMWYKDGEFLYGYWFKLENIFNILEVSGDNFGVYECEVRNNLGMIFMKMRVLNGEYNRFFFFFVF